MENEFDDLWATEIQPVMEEMCLGDTKKTKHTVEICGLTIKFTHDPNDKVIPITVDSTTFKDENGIVHDIGIGK